MERISEFGWITIVLLAIGAVIASILTSKRLKGSSLFNRLFIVVAVASGFFSAISSALGFSLITSQESDDLFRNALLPPAFGVFVFFLAVAIWVGGAELVRHRDWFRGMGNGFLGDLMFFFERALKLFVVIPVLAVILFFVSTWTTVVGIGGADAVRHTYQFEVERLQAECAGLTAYRQRDYLFLEDLRLSISGVARVADNERQGGAQTGSAGPGAVTDYFNGIADWLRDLETSVAAIIEGDDPSGVAPYAPEICATKIDNLQQLLSRNAFNNYDLWAREFETAYNDFASVLNRWRHDRRVEKLLEQQLASFARANPKPVNSLLTRAQSEAIDNYSEEVEKALSSLIKKQKRTKPPVPQKSAAELSPARGLGILVEFFETPTETVEVEKPPSRRQSVVDAEFAPGLSTITPRDAVLKHANIFSDIWALAISWDYAAYLLMFAYLFFPSAERAAGFKDEE
ncbi:MAG: hypothetical protein DHS20C05_13010 [Hyphococcus sp.]|nr:MAG: hypothetical protein DHS20C05_13010 [Marinicaulis sp.]